MRRTIHRPARTCLAGGCRERLPAGGKAVYCCDRCRAWGHRQRRKTAKHYLARGRSSGEWRTPAPIIEAARAAMGGIDLDPASCHSANVAVGAAAILTRDDDGIATPWPPGRSVWLNPPYESRSVLGFVRRACEHDGPAVVLTNAAIDTAWGGALLGNAAAVCLVRGRLRFLQPDGTPGPNPAHASMVVGLRVDPERFRDAFAALGSVWFPARGGAQAGRNNSHR